MNLHRRFEYATGRNLKAGDWAGRRHCAFCGIDGSTHFTAYSRTRPASRLCGNCIETFARMQRFTEFFRILYECKPDWSKLTRQIEKSLFGEPASPRLRQIMTAIATRLLQRAASLVVGNHPKTSPLCPVTGVGLAPPRIALVGKDAAGCERLFSLASGAAGLPVVCATGIELVARTPMKKLIALSNGQMSWGRLGSVFVSDGFFDDRTPVAMIFACKNRLALPVGVEDYDVDGFERSELC